MKFLQVVARVISGGRLVQKPVAGRSVAPLVDRAEIGEKISRATQRSDWAADPVGRRRVVPGLDVAPVLLDQSPQIAENAPPIRHRAAMQRCGQRHRPAQPCSQQLLAEEPADPRGLRGIEGELVEGGRHDPYGITPALRLCKGSRCPRPAMPRAAIPNREAGP